MTAFDTVLADVFERGAEARMEREEERRQIAAAQLGDEDATVALIYAYAPVLRAWSSRYTSRLGAEEARSLAISGLLEAIHAFNLREHSGQLAGIVWQHVSNALRDSGTLVTVPEWSRRTYLTILRTAGDDHPTAEKLAPSLGMTVETFRAVREALAATHLDVHGAQSRESDARNPYYSIDRATPIWIEDRAAVDQDVRDLAQEALSCLLPTPSAHRDGEDGDWVAEVIVATPAGPQVTHVGVFPKQGAATTAAREAAAAMVDEKWDIVRYAYGFVTGDPMSDEEVRKAISARDLGAEAVEAGESVMSRAKVQRVRRAALVTMKTSLEAVA